MKAVRNLLIYIFSTYLLVMFGLTGAQDYWCSTLVKGVIYGSYSVTEMFPKNYTNCTWTLENPDPTKYSIYLKLYKQDLSCSEYSLLAYQFDHYSHEKISELLKVNESIVYLCDTKNIYVFLLYDKNFVQLRRVFPYDYNGLTPQKLDEEEKSIVEFLVLNKATPSQFGCQVLCTWLENCLKLEKGTVETCGIVYTKCTCPQHLGDGESESMLMLNNVVLPLNPQTEGCLSPQLQGGQICNLSAEVKRPPKEVSPFSHTGESGAEEWSQWSSCSVTCGQGSQVRTRTCVSPYGTHCSGPLRESRVCNNTAPCPVHGVWEEWSPWSLCSFTCGRGHRTRTRMCAPPQHGGRACDGPETQTKLCNIALCPVDGQWQEWSSWSDCSVTCANGTQQRTRQCSAAAHGGSECRGHWAESRECHNPDCTANGQWNPWGPWSGCSKSCDGGWQRRARVCQGAAVTGQQCDGTGEEVRKCSDQRCPAPYEICPEDYAVSMVWRRTPSGELAFNRCPPNATGTTSRRCSLDHRGMAFWEQPSYARCITNEFRYLQQSVQGHLAKGQRMLAGDGMSQVTKNLLDLTQRRNFYAGDLLSSVEILRNVTETFKRASYEPSSDDVQVSKRRRVSKSAQGIYPGAVELMQVIEDFIHIVGLGMKDFHNAYLMTGNLVASIQRLPAVSVMTDINFPMKGRKGMVDWARNSEDKVVIPKGLFVSQSADMEGSPVFILGTVLYKTLGLMLNHTVVNSKVIAVTVRPEPKATESQLEIELAHNTNGTMGPYCALWDSTIIIYLPSRCRNDSWGAWSTKGCKTVLTDASHTKCLCDRVSTFAILAQQPREITMEYSGVPSVTLIVGCGLSCLALITLAVIYAVLWRYIRSERSIILLNFCLSIVCSNILILVGQTQTHNAGVCVMTTAFLHFFFLASFCWVLTEAWQSYMAVTGKVRTRLIRKRFLCLGWGLPALVVAVSMGFTKTKGYGTPLYCWLSLEGGLLYAFVGPAAAVVLVNMVIGILVFNKLVSRDGILDKKLKHRAGASLWSSCVVLPLLALTWMSAVLAMTDKRSILFQILFAVFDSLQGFVIVMVHCILRREVQDAFRCRLRNCQDPIGGDATGTFPNGHAQIMTDFEKDVDIACRSALHKDMGSCRAATITGTLSRISLNDEEEEKAPEGLNYSTLPGNIMSKVIIQQPSALHLPMGVGDLKEQCMADGNADMRRTVYLCTDDTMRQSEHDMMGRDMEGHPVAAQMMETDYIVMPRASAAAVSGSCNTSTLLKDDSKMNITMDTLQHERLMHCKMSPDFSLGPSGMDHMNVNLEQHYPSAPEQMQNLPFEPRTAVKNFLRCIFLPHASKYYSEMTLNPLVFNFQRRKSRYSDLDFEKVMHTRKRHMELFQELNQKFQTLDRFRDIPNMGTMVSNRKPGEGGAWEGEPLSAPTPGGCRQTMAGFVGSPRSTRQIGTETGQQTQANCSRSAGGAAGAFLPGRHDIPHSYSNQPLSTL
uniref:Adhesion G protein-coupled receptor B3 n=1 Tax=Takifugu rubripes TaxID=31033 RepID=A0A674ND28_TAKRU